MKFEPWTLDPKMIEVSDDRNNRIGFITNPHSSQAVFISVGRGNEIGLNGVREILSHMEPTTVEQSVEGKSDGR